MLPQKIAVLLLISSLEIVFARDYFVGVNGTPQYRGNYVEMETYDFKGLLRLYPKKNRQIFNSSGPDAMFIRSDDQLRHGRDEKGNVLYVRTEIPESKPATRLEVFSGLAQVRSLNPRKVLVLFGNHGSDDGAFQTIDGDITSQEAAGLINQFNETTTVQTIFAHCYSGLSMVTNKDGKKISEIKYVHQLEEFFKRNKCAMSAAQPEEVSYSFDISRAVTKNPQISLAELYSLMMSQDVRSTPMLSSYVMLEAFAEVVCASRTEAGVCTEDCEKNKRVCESLDNVLLRKHESFIPKDLDQYSSAVFSHKEYELTKKNNPQLAADYEQALNDYNKWMMCSELGVMKDVVEDCSGNIDENLEASLAVIRKMEEELARFESSKESFMDHQNKMISEMAYAGYDAQNIIDALEFPNSRKETPQYAFTMQEYHRVLKLFEPMLAEYPRIKELYDSVVRCEKQPLGPLPN